MLCVRLSFAGAGVAGGLGVACTCEVMKMGVIGWYRYVGSLRVRFTLGGWGC